MIISLINWSILSKFWPHFKRVLRDECYLSNYCAAGGGFVYDNNEITKTQLTFI